MQEKCHELEKLQQKHNNFYLHRKVRELSDGNENILPYGLQDIDIQPVNHNMRKIASWEYDFHYLFLVTREMPPIGDNEEGSTCSKSVVEYDITHLKNNEVKVKRKCQNVTI